ncbi:secretion protein EspK [Mycolicibacterium sphagni]|uniref:Secretion protein EspK n=1 Tax=Mycolicibacterium sphagni TaxID=1786 RepID=A0ABX2JV17_9MYCO|nr:secretion protein EspK [Mycolicibacterium sphagni]NTY60702.1 secretion protein EspK [Mycolicibacterium sphagni]
MGVAMPTGGYVGQMLEPGGWPEADENVFYDRAQQFAHVLRGVTDVLDTCLQQRSRVFEGGIWSGGAAIAADGELGARIDYLMSLQENIAGASTWHDHIAVAIAHTKSDIADNVDTALRQITVIQNDPTLEADERTSAINAVLATTYAANVGMVTATAEQIVATQAWNPPKDAVPGLLDRQMPPVDLTLSTPTQPGTSQPGTTVPGVIDPGTTQPGAAEPGATDPGSTQPGTSQPGGSQPEDSLPDTRLPDGNPTDGQPTTPTQPEADAPTANPAAPQPAFPGGSIIPPMPGGGQTTGPRPPAESIRPNAPTPPAIAAEDGGSVAAPAIPAAAAGADGGGKGLAPASASPTPTVPASMGTTHREDPGPAVAPAAAAPVAGGGVPGGGTMAPAARGGGGASSGPAATGGAPVSQRPMSQHPSSRATSGSNRTAAARNAPNPAPPDRATLADAAAAVAIPVSAALAARDAIAAASADNSEGRAGGGPDPLRLARRIAAALNAPDSDGHDDFGFFWVTGVTTDGEIVVANSYGLAYIPAGVHLPRPVHMATADDAIAPSERVPWATYPLVAVQGWATHRGKKLRAVIATEAHFGQSDAGAAKVVLAPDEIPEAGGMSGRARLEVVDTEAAQRLADTTDRQLSALLPPVPASAEPPADKRPLMWFDVMKPMASNATGREAAHLRAFHAYVLHAEAVALAESHSTVDPVDRRTVIADWLYWKHLGALLNSALTTTV